MTQFKPVNEKQVDLDMIDEFISRKDKEEMRFEVLGAFITYPYHGDEVKTVCADNFITSKESIHDMTDQVRRYFGQDLIKVFTTDRGIRAIVRDIHDDEGIHIYDFVLAIYTRKPVARLES